MADLDTQLAALVKRARRLAGSDDAATRERGAQAYALAGRLRVRAVREPGIASALADLLRALAWLEAAPARETVTDAAIAAAIQRTGSKTAAARELRMSRRQVIRRTARV